MKALLPALSALALLATPVTALPAPAEQPPKPEAAAPAAPAADKPAEKPADKPAIKAADKPADATALPAPVKITRWEDTGLTPGEAREWQSYGFTPQEGMNWSRAEFAPVVARTWSDKGFDPDEAQTWRDSAKSSRTLMAELDHSDPAAWKREGFSPYDRLAWWEAGFVFDDAVLLARAGMTPGDAAWHGHDKLKELRAQASPADRGAADTGPSATRMPDIPSIWNVVGPFVKVALVALAAFIAGGLAFFLYRRAQVNRKMARIRPDAPNSELPPSAASVQVEPDTPVYKMPEKRKPARQVMLIKRAKPRCIHCQSEKVRPSKMGPHKFAGINFTEYFRCKNCGRHFAIVSYTPILLTGGGIMLALTLLIASFFYIVSVS